MSLGPAVNVAIGLMFIYLLLGLLASSMQELIAGWLNKRATVLRDGIAQLLTGTGAKAAASDPLFGRIFGHALVSGTAPSKMPAYVAPANFVLAVIDAVSDRSGAPLFTQVEKGVAALPNGPAKAALTALVNDAAGDVDKLKTNLGTWFDSAMDRVSGAYKRSAHTIALVLGFVIAIGLNIDSVAVAEWLWKNPAAATAFDAQMQARLQPAPVNAGGGDQTKTDVAGGPPQMSLPDLDTLMSQLPIPMGWKPKAADHSWWQYFTADAGIGASTAVGWLITAFAVSLGAPFWFDTLQRIFNLRSAGPKPARTDDPS